MLAFEVTYKVGRSHEIRLGDTITAIDHKSAFKLAIKKHLPWLIMNKSRISAFIVYCWNDRRPLDYGYMENKIPTAVGVVPKFDFFKMIEEQTNLTKSE